jgi:predicted nucleic acid-binding protein
MTYLSSLADEPSPLVLDTSVVINLRASQSGADLLRALPNKICVPAIVASELGRESARASGERQFLSDLLDEGQVHLVTLSQEENELYHRLVSGDDSIDDGEAATISIAHYRECRPVIDEKRGRRHSLSCVPMKPPGWSLDLFLHPLVIERLDHQRRLLALYLALRDGRMRISESHCAHVVNLIGFARALDCKSLPGYKARRDSWHQALANPEPFLEGFH